MKFRKPVMALLVAASLGAITQAPSALADVDVYFGIAPPAARYEAVPSPRAGYIWAPGYWDAHNGRHAWRKGHWEAERSGHHYVEPRWVEHKGWALERGRWNRNDRDGDGVPNNRDHQPDNPRRY